MSRSISAGQASAIAAAHVVGCHLVELDFPGGTSRYTDAPHDIVAGGNTYLGVGRLGSIEAIRESASPEATGIKLTLAGPVSSLLSIALTEHVQGVAVRIYMAFLNETTLQPIDTPVLEWSGLTDVLSVTDAGDSSSIVLTAESRFAQFARPRIRRHNQADQQAVYAGDLFYSFTPGMVDKSIVWPARSWFANNT